MTSDLADVQILLESGALISILDEGGRRALSWATIPHARDDTRASALLIKHGAEVDEQDGTGWTLLSWAV